MDAQIDELVTPPEPVPRPTGRPAAARGARPRGAADPGRGPAHGHPGRGRNPPGQPRARRPTTRRSPSTSSRATRSSTRPSAGSPRLITVTIATQQPVARDLRFLLTLDHVTYELERIGDHASSRRQAGPQARPGAAAQGLRPPARDGRARRPSWSTASFGPWSTRRGAAREVAVEDDEIDRLYHAIFDEVVELMREDPANVERGTRIIIASHYLERIGDRATNIAEDVVYLVTGDVEDLNP